MKRLINIWKNWPYVESDWQRFHNEISGNEKKIKSIIYCISELENKIEKTKHQMDKLRSEYHHLKREKYI
jgi:peptidoglycan hydrolase CwlO-like protein